MSTVMEKPRLIYQFDVRRRVHLRRFLWNLLAVVGAVGAWAAFFYLSQPSSDPRLERAYEALPPLLLTIGQVIGLGAAAVFAVRAVFALARAVRTRSQSAQFYDRGFRWQRGTEVNQYAWSSVRNFREGYHQMKVGRAVLGGWGGNALEMKDGKTYRFTAIHGNPKIFARVIRPYITEAVGERMAQALREGKTIRLHPQFVVARAGVQARKEKIRWSELDIKVGRGRLLVKRADKKGKFKTVTSFPLSQLNNVSAFLDLASSTIQNHQPERFNIKTQKLTYR